MWRRLNLICASLSTDSHTLSLFVLQWWQICAPFFSATSLFPVPDVTLSVLTPRGSRFSLSGGGPKCGRRSASGGSKRRRDGERAAAVVFYSLLRALLTFRLYQAARWKVVTLRWILLDSISWREKSLHNIRHCVTTCNVSGLVKLTFTPNIWI